MGIPLFVNQFIDLFFHSKKCVKFGNLSPYWIYPNLFSEDSIVYSGGAGLDISFELALQKNFNLKIFLFDPSPTGIGLNKGLKNSKIKFYPWGLAGKAGEYYFQDPKSKNEGSYFPSFEKTCNFFKCVSISDFFKMSAHKKIDLLKIDIEGFEYNVIDDILNNKVPISQIVLEFHHHLKGGSILKTLKYIIKLKNAGYKLIYKHIDEFTFLKK